jgi:hypothetical protein
LGKKKGSGDNLGKVFLPHFFAGLEDRRQDLLRGYKALVELHVEEAGYLAELGPGDPRDAPDGGAHGVGAAGSGNPGLFLHAIHREGKPG